MTTQIDKDSAAIDTITAKFKALLDQNWIQIKAYATDPEAGGKINASFSVGLNFTGKTPCGSIGIGYGPKRRKDAAEFHVEDPDQEKLPLDKDPPIGIQFGPEHYAGRFVEGVEKTLAEGQSMTLRTGSGDQVTIRGKRKGGAK